MHLTNVWFSYFAQLQMWDSHFINSIYFFLSFYLSYIRCKQQYIHIYIYISVSVSGTTVSPKSPNQIASKTSTSAPTTPKHRPRVKDISGVTNHRAQYIIMHADGIQHTYIHIRIHAYICVKFLNTFCTYGNVNHIWYKSFLKLITLRLSLSHTHTIILISIITIIILIIIIMIIIILILTTILRGWFWHQFGRSEHRWGRVCCPGRIIRRLKHSEKERNVHWLTSLQWR
jgi:hypothetical protein